MKNKYLVTFVQIWVNTDNNTSAEQNMVILCHSLLSEVVKAIMNVLVYSYINHLKNSTYPYINNWKNNQKKKYQKIVRFFRKRSFNSPEF